jgi:FkbM family methyltransferase
MQNSLFLARLLRKFKFIRNGYPGIFNFNLSKRINNLKFRIPIIKNIGWNNIFDNEPWMTRLLEKLLSGRKGIFVDVGANIGQTLIKLKSIDPGVFYFGFEANPVCLFYLKELIKANKFESTAIIPVGLSDETGLASLNFFSKYSDDATASVLDQLRPGSVIEKKEWVYLTTIDKLSHLFTDKISILKIDVEGAELEVLKGAISCIKNHRPLIIIEILPVYTAENTWRLGRQNELESLVQSANYKKFRISKDSKNDLLSLDYIDNIGINSNILERDYLLVPGEINLDPYTFHII